MKTIGFIMGWAAVALGLYASVLGLEVKWNLINWAPGIDSSVPPLLGLLLASVAGTWFLALRTRDRIPRVCALIVGLSLAALGCYVLPPEVSPKGSFAREIVSPLWYRAARPTAVSLPLLFVLVQLRRDVKRPL